jgi:hypothetical protein
MTTGAPDFALHFQRDGNKMGGQFKSERFEGFQGIGNAASEGGISVNCNMMPGRQLFHCAACQITRFPANLRPPDMGRNATANAKQSDGSNLGFADGNDDGIEANKTDIIANNSFAGMPKGVHVRVCDNYFPDAQIWREGNKLIVEITEHIYTKFWAHKWHGRVFADAMLRAIKRFIAEGYPFSKGEIENDDDPHIFIRWQLRLPVTTKGQQVIEAIETAYELVYSRADLILENAESVLLLGKDTGKSMKRLRLIAARLEELGYYPVIIKDQPDKLGESVIQKVMRHALSSRFVLVENTEASGHLYEIPHVGKAAECVIGFLQEKGKGATWMFEDAYARNQHWQKFPYAPAAIGNAVTEAAEWAEKFITKFGDFQQRVLPWMKPSKPPRKRTRKPGKV